ncbi:MAG: glycosyltransferase family 39 protein [Bryobacteraceae bacterium]|nr:glycosyltransferase family 39 protein [Bryobacteraceae bacterium]
MTHSAWKQPRFRNSWTSGSSEPRFLLLQALVAAGAAATWLTEGLSLFGWVTFNGIVVGWTALGATGAVLVWRRGSPRFHLPRPGLPDVLLTAGMAAIAAIAGFIAIVSPPNSVDALMYHMPRVVYWKLAGSVAFFPTQYLNQIMQPPLAEYLVLHTYILSGGDRFANLVQFGGFLACLVAVSLIAKALGAGRRGQIIAALFCATLPNGILQASGTKNEWLLAMWLAAAVCFAFRSKYLWMGLAVGLALLTKGTAYIFAPAVLLGVFAPRMKQAWRAVVAVGLCTLAINGPQYWRNIGLSGSPLGYDSAQGDGLFRWRNERFGIRPAVSNMLRHISEQLGSRGEAWNQGAYRAVLRAHGVIGADPNDPATTWRWSEYEPPRNTNHETDANNRWHLLLLAGCVIWLAPRMRERQALFYCLSIGLAFVLFCAYLKWQPFQARMFLPLFALVSPIAGLALGRLRPAILQAALCLFLLNNARPYLFENWIRPLKGPNSILGTSRRDAYFADMTQWNNRVHFLRAVDLARESGCGEVGIDITHFQLEYPVQALLLETNPKTRFQHLGVTNASARYRDLATPPPCAVVCLRCAGDAGKIQDYSAIGPPAEAGDFLVFTKNRSVIRNSAAPAPP